MTRFLLQIFLLLLFHLNLLANSGKKVAVPHDVILQQTPSILSIQDNFEKTIIIWENYSTIDEHNPQYYAQRLAPTGELLWGKSVELTKGSPRVQSSHKVVSDGSGGVIITWEEKQGEREETDIFAQKIDSAGKRVWGDGGIKISPQAGSQISPVITTDGSGGAIIAWNDSRNDPTYTNWDIYAQHISADGLVKWDADGILISADIKDEFIGKILPSDDGGATIIWNMVIPGITGDGEGYDFYSKKLKSNGQWDPNSSSPKFLSLPVGQTNYRLAGDIINDGQNGFFLSLLAETGDKISTRLCLQHVLPTGEAAFPHAYGVLLKDSVNQLQNIHYIKDNIGNIEVSWTEKDSESLITYTQKLEPSGSSVSDTITLSSNELYSALMDSASISVSNGPALASLTIDSSPVSTPAKRNEAGRNKPVKNRHAHSKTIPRENSLTPEKSVFTQAKDAREQTDVREVNKETFEPVTWNLNQGPAPFSIDSAQVEGMDIVQSDELRAICTKVIGVNSESFSFSQSIVSFPDKSSGKPTTEPFANSPGPLLPGYLTPV